MVSRRVEEAMKERLQEAAMTKGGYQNGHIHSSSNNSSYKEYVQCNKGKSSKFKRSTSNLEQDGLSAAIFLLACVACTPSN